MQLSLAEEVVAEREAARPPKIAASCTWMQCDSCLKWRRMPKCFAPTGEEAEQLVSWTCAMLPVACEAPEVTLTLALILTLTPTLTPTPTLT